MVGQPVCRGSEDNPTQVKCFRSILGSPYMPVRCHPHLHIHETKRFQVFPMLHCPLDLGRCDIQRTMCSYMLLTREASLAGYSVVNTIHVFSSLGSLDLITSITHTKTVIPFAFRPATARRCCTGRPGTSSARAATSRRTAGEM